MTNPNTQLTCLVIRPSPDGEALCEDLQKAGFNTVFHPTLTITALPYNTAQLQKHYDGIIFVSRNAVRYSENIHHTFKAARVFAMGPSTEALLKSYGFSNLTSPPKPYTSEALLAMNAFTSLKNQRWLIVKGEGGREHLIRELKTKGAGVDTLSVYKRSVSIIDPTHLQTQLTQQQLDCVISTSYESLKNLIEQSAHASTHLFKLPLMVSSKRLFRFAEDLGFVSIYVAAGATSDEIIYLLQKLAQETASND